MADDVQEILLRVRSDRTSITNARRDIFTIKAGLRDLDNANFNRLIASQGKTLDSIKALRTEVNKTIDDVERLDSASSRVKAPTAASSGSSGSFSGKRTAEGISNVASLVGQVAGAEAGGALRLVGEITKVTEVLPQLRTEVAKLGVSGLVAAAAIAAAVVVVSEFNKQGEAITSGLRGVIDREKEYYELRVKGSRDSINAAIELAKFEQQVAQARLNDLAGVPEAYKQAGEQLGVFTGGIIELGGALGVGGLGNVRDAKNAYDEAQKELAKANDKLNLYNGLLSDQTVILNTALEAQKEYTAIIVSDLKEATQKQVELARFTRTATTEQLEDRITANNEQLDALAKEAEGLLALQAAGSDVRAELFRVQDATNALTTENRLLDSSIRESIGVREAAKAAEDELNKKRADSIAAYKRYSDDIVKLTEQEQKARADLEARYADTKIKIAQAAADAAEKALERLREQQSSLATDLARAEVDAQAQAQQDTLDAQIAFQQDEARDAREHADNLLDIRRRAAESEEDLIAKRDFASLFRSRRNTNNQLDEATKQYAQQRNERLIAFQEENDDRARQFAFDAQQRQIKYQRDLSDAQAQYNKELNLARTNKNRALVEAAAAYVRDGQLLRDKLNSELNSRKQAITSELLMIQQGNALKLKLEADYYAASQALIKGFVTGAGTVSGFGGSAAGKGKQNVNNITQNYTISSGIDANKVAKVVEQKTGAMFEALTK